MKIKIGDKLIGGHNPCFIIAEAGINHNGEVKLAEKLIDTAKDSGCDAIKFQTFKTEELVTITAPTAKYQRENTSSGSQYKMLKKLELTNMEFKEIFDYCKRKKIIFLSTPFDFSSAEFLNKLEVPAFKTSSGDLTNIPLLIQIARYSKPIILSTGMSTLHEVQEAVKAIYSTGNRKLALLHCTSNYPTKYEDVNLRAIITLRKKFNVPVGYSDHTKGIEVAIASVPFGANIIEKHFTLDRNLPGPDHKTSAEPKEFKAMVDAIRNVEKSLGTGIKKPQKSEIEIKNVARKSIVAGVDIPKNTKIAFDMLTIKRPGTGISPIYLSKIVKKKTLANIKKDELISWNKIN